jgi:GTPase SAR1 family protein
VIFASVALFFCFHFSLLATRRLLLKLVLPYVDDLDTGYALSLVCRCWSEIIKKDAFLNQKLLQLSMFDFYPSAPHHLSVAQAVEELRSGPKKKKGKPDFDFQIIFFGDKKTGKTTTIQELLPTPRIETGDYEKVIHFDYNWHNKIVRLLIYDTCYQSGFDTPVPPWERLLVPDSKNLRIQECFSKYRTIAVFYDVNSRESFLSAAKILKFCRNAFGNTYNYNICLVANMTDTRREMHKVTREQGMDLAKMYQVLFAESSTFVRREQLLAWVERLMINWIRRKPFPNSSASAEKCILQ